MNVLMFGWEFPPNISGGLGTACYGIVNGLSACNDVQVTFVVPKAFGNEQSNNIKLISANDTTIKSKPRKSKNLRQLIRQNINTVNYIEIPSQIVPYVTPENFEANSRLEVERRLKLHTTNSSDGTKISFSGRYGHNLFDEINNYAIVAQTIAQENEFEIIHAHDWLTFPAGIAAKKTSGKPLVIHVHSTDFDRSGGSVNPIIYSIEKRGMEEADKIIAVSNRIKDIIIRKYQIAAEKITTIYNAIEKPQHNFENVKKAGKKDKIVTFLGRITIQKGPEYFLEVARLVLARMKNVHFVMAGSGEMREKIIELSAKSGISNRFHFTGFLDGPDVSQMLHNSDLFIMPSVSEPFGIVPLEAMQANVPVIISLQSGKPVRLNFWDVHAMADAVHGILKHKKLSKTMISEGKIEISKLSWEVSAEQIKQVYINTILKEAS